MNILVENLGIPRMPSHLTLRPYQEQAINNWFANRGRGILKMATGTGKTIMAIQSMKGLIQRYNALEAKIAYIYALCFRGVRQLPSKYLLNYLKENITSEHLLNEPSGMKIQVRCEDIFSFSEEKGISMDMQNLRFFSPLDLIQEISHRLNQLHRDGPVILFVDEFELIEVKESDVAELGWDYNWNGCIPLLSNLLK